MCKEKQERGRRGNCKRITTCKNKRRVKEEKGNKNLKNKDLTDMMELEYKITSTSHPKKGSKIKIYKASQVAKNADIKNITAMKCQELLKKKKEDTFLILDSDWM